jgi:hypothetical protein
VLACCITGLKFFEGRILECSLTFPANTILGICGLSNIYRRYVLVRKVDVASDYSNISAIC